MTEIFFDARRKGILTYVVNATEKIQRSIKKFGITNDDFTSVDGLEKFREFGGIIPTTEKSETVWDKSTMDIEADEEVGIESFGIDGESKII